MAAKWKTIPRQDIDKISNDVGAPDQSRLMLPGIVDSMHTADLEREKIMQTLERMGDAEKVLWSAVEKSRTDSAQLKDADIRALRVLLEHMSDALERYLQKLIAESVLLKGHLRSFIDAFEITINLYFEESHGDIAYLANAPAMIATLINGLSAARENLKQFRQVLELIPGYTARFTDIKRIAAAIFADLSGSMAVQIGHLERIQQDILRRLQDKDRTYYIDAHK